MRAVGWERKFINIEANKIKVNDEGGDVFEGLGDYADARRTGLLC